MTSRAVPLLAAALLAACAFAQDAPPLVACWHFDEGKGAYALDASEMGNDARLVGGTWIEGVAGGAVRLSGDGEAIIADGVGALPEGGVEAWVRFDAPPRGQVGVVTFGRELGGRNDAAILGLCPSLRAARGLVMGFCPHAWEGAVSEVIPEVGKWVHLAAAWGREGVSLYLDGEEIARDETYTRGLPAHPHVLIGAGSWNAHLACAVDEVRIYGARPDPDLFRRHAGDLAYVAEPPTPKAPRGLGPRPAIDAADYYDPESPSGGLQEAIDAVPRAGGAVTIPPGVYLLKRGLVLRGGVTLRGAGPGTVLRKAPEVLSALAADVPEKATQVEVQDAAGFEVGMEIGILDRAMRGWHITHAHITAVEGNRIEFHPPTHRSYEVARDGMVVSHFPAITASGQADFTIESLRIEGDLPRQPTTRTSDFTFAAVHIVNCRRLRLRDLFINGWPSDGIGVQGGSEAQVTDCIVQGCRGNGFHPGTSLVNAVFTGNIGRENEWDGLYFCMYVRHSTVSNNVFYRNGWSGIGGLGNGGDEWNTVSANTCVANGRAGIQVNDGKNNTVTGNVCLNNSQSAPGRWAGITIQNSTGSLIVGNRVSDNQETPTQLVGISERGDSDHNLITGNHLHGSQTPLETVGAHTQVTGNLPREG